MHRLRVVLLVFIVPSIHLTDLTAGMCFSLPNVSTPTSPHTIFYVATQFLIVCILSHHFLFCYTILHFVTPYFDTSHHFRFCHFDDRATMNESISMKVVGTQEAFIAASAASDAMEDRQEAWDAADAMEDSEPRSHAFPAKPKGTTGVMKPVVLKPAKAMMAKKPTPKPRGSVARLVVPKFVPAEAKAMPKTYILQRFPAKASKASAAKTPLPAKTPRPALPTSSKAPQPTQKEHMQHALS